MATEIKYIDTKSDGKSKPFITAWTQMCPVIEVVLDQMEGLKITALPEPCTVSYLAYELGVLSDLQVGEIM